MDTVYLKKRMSEKKIDASTLADRCFVAPRYMEQVLKGLMPSKRLILSIARELECDPCKVAPEIGPELNKTIKGGSKATVS
jgi:transcriptional regulator with XRE-family HTH domain